LSDDETLIVLNEQGEYLAHPFPTWSDYLFDRSRKTWDVQCSLPLSGLFFLEQSDMDSVEPLGEGTAAVRMTESAVEICEKFWRGSNGNCEKKSRIRLFNNACRMAKSVPAYSLSTSLEGRFWEKMEEVIAFQ
jgi:SynChlorMet cassette protein ScmC